MARRKSSILFGVIFLGMLWLVFQQMSLSALVATPPPGPLQVPLQPQRRQRFIPTRNDNNSTFSACLLVMDDNHFLMEWLAYHYHTMPLRYLIIAVDPRSKTSPKLILDRWEPYMTIVRWSDRRYLPEEWQNRLVSEDARPQLKLMKHRERQRNFYLTCLGVLKQAGRTWAMATDIDEYVLQNRDWTGYREDYPTLLDAIQAQAPPRDTTTCIPIPRVRYGTREGQGGNDTNPDQKQSPPDTSVSFAPPGFSDRDFVTLRYRWRAGLHSKPDNKHSKSILNVARIPVTSFTRQETDAHRPVRSECPKRNLYILTRASPYRIHHYVGSQEQFFFRNDARRGMATRSVEQWQDYGKVQQSYDTSITGWLQNFVKSVGVETAQSLLEGVGNVSYTPLRRVLPKPLQSP